MRGERDENGLRKYERTMLSGDGGLAKQLVAVKAMLANRRPLKRATEKNQDYSKPVDPSSLEGLMMKQKRPSILIDGKPAKATFVNGTMTFPDGKISINYGELCSYSFCSSHLKGRLRQLRDAGYVEQSESIPFYYSLTQAGLREAIRGDAAIVAMCQIANAKYLLTPDGYEANSPISKNAKINTLRPHAVVIKKSKEPPPVAKVSKPATRPPEAKSKEQSAQNKKRELAAPYDFDGWFDALNAKPDQVILLTRGKDKDFPCRANSMAVQLRMAAATYGIKISISIEDDNHLVLRKRHTFGSE